MSIDFNHRTVTWPQRLALLMAAAALMILPLIALRGLDPAAWDSPGDFMFLAILLTGIATAHEVAMRIPPRRAHAAATALAVGTALLTLWINLAVGIIGSEDNPANWIFAAAPAVAVLGALLARFAASGMARAMAAAAAAQGLAFAGALIAGLGFTGPITVFFAALWLIAAQLFRRAATLAPGRGGPTLVS